MPAGAEKRTNEPPGAQARGAPRADRRRVPKSAYLCQREIHSFRLRGESLEQFCELGADVLLPGLLKRQRLRAGPGRGGPRLASRAIGHPHARQRPLMQLRRCTTRTGHGCGLHPAPERQENRGAETEWERALEQPELPVTEAARSTPSVADISHNYHC